MMPTSIVRLGLVTRQENEAKGFRQRILPRSSQVIRELSVSVKSKLKHPPPAFEFSEIFVQIPPSRG